MADSDALDLPFDQQYRLEEMKTLRAEINIQVQELYKLENFALLAMGAVASVAFLSENPKLPEVGYFLAAVPFIVTCYCFYRHRAIRELIRHMDEYLQALEARSPGVSMIIDGKPEIVSGWVGYYVSHATNYKRIERIFWAILIFTGLGIFIGYCALRPFPKPPPAVVQKTTVDGQANVPASANPAK